MKPVLTTRMRVAVGRRRAAIVAVPVLPPAPGNVLHVDLLAELSESFCATRRAITSVGPPAANGTIRRTELAG